MTETSTAEPLHISEATLIVLASRGWRVSGRSASKTFAKVAPEGMFSNGARTLRVEFSEDGRWLEHYDGFRLSFDMDSRDYFGRPYDFADEIERKVLICIA